MDGKHKLNCIYFVFDKTFPSNGKVIYDKQNKPVTHHTKFLQPKGRCKREKSPFFPLQKCLLPENDTKREGIFMNMHDHCLLSYIYHESADEITFISIIKTYCFDIEPFQTNKLIIL